MVDNLHRLLRLLGIDVSQQSHDANDTQQYL